MATDTDIVSRWFDAAARPFTGGHAAAVHGLGDAAARDSGEAR